MAGLLLDVLDPLDDRVFQTIFGEVMALLIALVTDQVVDILASFPTLAAAA